MSYPVTKPLAAKRPTGLAPAVCLGLLWCLLGVSITGCGSPAPYEFDTLDLTPTQDEMIEFSLGSYSIPIPAQRRLDAKERLLQNRIVLTFELYTLIPREMEPELSLAWEQHEGKVRDRVIRVCRNASLEELQEAELSTLKAHMADGIQSQFGRTEIRRLLIAEVQQREL